MNVFLHYVSISNYMVVFLSQSMERKQVCSVQYPYAFGKIPGLFCRFYEQFCTENEVILHPET